MAKHSRTAAKRDANEADIIKAIEEMGATVTQLDQPVDLLVSHESAWYLIEVKNPATQYGKSGANYTQKDWIGKQKAAVWVVYTPEQALEVLSKAK